MDAIGLGTRFCLLMTPILALGLCRFRMRVATGDWFVMTCGMILILEFSALVLVSIGMYHVACISLADSCCLTL